MPLLARTSLAAWLRRALAAGSAALVLALTIFAASPAAHEWLHVDDGHRTSDDGCAVVLFASGAPMPMGAVIVPAPGELPSTIPPAIAAEIFLVSPRYLRHPERGPPVSWVA